MRQNIAKMMKWAFSFIAWYKYTNDTEVIDSLLSLVKINLPYSQRIKIKLWNKKDIFSADLMDPEIPKS